MSVEPICTGLPGFGLEMLLPRASRHFRSDPARKRPQTHLQFVGRPKTWIGRVGVPSKYLSDLRGGLRRHLLKRFSTREHEPPPPSRRMQSITPPLSARAHLTLCSSLHRKTQQLSQCFVHAACEFSAAAPLPSHTYSTPMHSKPTRLPCVRWRVVVVSICVVLERDLKYLSMHPKEQGVNRRFW